MDRRKFLTYVGCTCCSLALNSCATAPITDRKQLKLIPEAKLNAQAAQIFEKIKRKKCREWVEKNASADIFANKVVNWLNKVIIEYK